MDVTTIQRKIQAECSEYIALASEAGLPLLRGMKKCPVEPCLDVQPNQFTSRHGYDREFFDKMVDTELTKRKLLKRKEATFAISPVKQNIAEDFGETFYVFPKNGARYCYTDGVVDLYPQFEHWLSTKAKSDYRASERSRDYLRDSMGDLWIVEEYCNRSPALKKFIRDAFIREQEFSDADLIKAIRSGWEIWFSGEFHALPSKHPESIDFVDSIFKQQASAAMATN